VIIIALQTQGMLNTLNFFYSDKTKAQLLGSQYKQWTLLRKV